MEKREKIVSAQLEIINDAELKLTLTSDTGEVFTVPIKDHLYDTWQYHEKIGDLNLVTDEFEGEGIFTTELGIYPKCYPEKEFEDTDGYVLKLINSDQTILNEWNDKFDWDKTFGYHG